MLPAGPIEVSLPGVTQVSGPSFQLQVSVTRYQFVPVGGAGSVKAQSSNLAQEGVGEAGKFYVVQRGDSPAGIARKFKVNYADLLKVNNIEDPKKLQIGQKLVIP